jgi:hypothetical protein
MDESTVLIFIVVMSVAIVVAMAMQQSKNRSAMSASVASIPDFRSSQEFMGEDGKAGISVDEVSKKVCLTTAGPPPVVRTYGYKDILEAEVLVAGATVTKTSRTSQAGRALLGGVVLGPIGMLAGALTAKQTSTNRVNRVDLRIVVNDPDHPVHVINCLTVHDAQAWHGRVLALIRQADNDDHLSPESSPPAAFSVADEIAKLARLRSDGLITDEEFNQQKLNLLKPV